MDAPTLARMFEPFFTTKSAGEGTGLGLSAVYGIVQAHEGAIVVESQPDEGTTFDIFLPLAAPGAVTLPAQGAGNSPAGRASSIAGRHILYIDDDEALLLLVKRLLQRRGLRVSAHGNQNEALDMLRADPAAVDLVVTDYDMPGMSGLQVARAIRQIRPDLPVVVASGFVDETLAAQAKDAGIRELIFKATAVEDYCGVIERLLAREMAVSR
jgi:CheY-like chemotaxis protein